MDCHNITRIINWGAPTTLEELVQETGRAGRDESEAEAILYYGQGANKYISKEMKVYRENQAERRRTLLFKDFLFSDIAKQAVLACRCCDLCALMCNCVKCNLE